MHSAAIYGGLPIMFWVLLYSRYHPNACLDHRHVKTWYTPIDVATQRGICSEICPNRIIGDKTALSVHPRYVCFLSVHSLALGFYRYDELPHRVAVSSSTRGLLLDLHNCVAHLTFWGKHILHLRVRVRVRVKTKLCIFVLDGWIDRQTEQDPSLYTSSQHLWILNLHVPRIRYITRNSTTSSPWIHSHGNEGESEEHLSPYVRRIWW